MKKEILELTGLPEDQFYEKYPTQKDFEKAYPGYKKKLGGSLPEAFNMTMPMDKFFSYGVPVPPMYHKMGGSLTEVPVFPQAQTEAQFFVPTYSNSNNAYKKGGNIVGGSYLEVHPEARNLGWSPTNYFMLQHGGGYTQDMNMPGTLPMLKQGTLQKGGNPGKTDEKQEFAVEKTQNMLNKIREMAYNAMLKQQSQGVTQMQQEDTQSFNSPMPNMPVAKYGGLKKFQGEKGSSQTTSTDTQPTAAAPAEWKRIEDNGRKGVVDPATGQVYWDKPFYSSRSDYRDYDYDYDRRYYDPRYNYRDPYVFQDPSGVFNVLQAFTQPRPTQWRDWNVKGLENFTPEQLKQIGISSVETRRALLPGNRVKRINFYAPVMTANQTVATTPETAKGPAQQSTNAAPAVSQQTDGQQALKGMMPNIPTALEDGESIDPIGYVDPGMSDVNMIKAIGVNYLPPQIAQTQTVSSPTSSSTPTNVETGASQPTPSTNFGYRSLSNLQSAFDKIPTKGYSPKGSIDNANARQNLAYMLQAAQQKENDENVSPEDYENYLKDIQARFADYGYKKGGSFRRGGPYALPMFETAGPWTGENSFSEDYNREMMGEPENPFYIPTSYDGQENYVMAPVDLATNKDGSLAGTGVLQPGYALTKDGKTVGQPAQGSLEISKMKGPKRITQLAANLGSEANTMIENAAVANFNEQMSRAENLALYALQKKGDRVMNRPVGSDLRPNQQVFAQNTGYGVYSAQYGGSQPPLVSGDNFYLTPWILEYLNKYRS